MPYLSASEAVAIHYESAVEMLHYSALYKCTTDIDINIDEESLYKVYAPLPLPLSLFI